LKNKQNKAPKLPPSNMPNWSAGPNKPLELPSLDAALSSQTEAPPSLTLDKLMKGFQPLTPMHAPRQLPAPMPQIQVPATVYVSKNNSPPYLAFKDAADRLAPRPAGQGNRSVPSIKANEKH
jgi:hypothetical protein